MAGKVAVGADVEERIAARYRQLSPFLDERRLRLWAATEAEALGRGGQAAVVRATGISGLTVAQGRKELADPQSVPSDAATMSIRQPGGGRPRTEDKQPGIREALRGLVEPTRRGDPVSAMSWTTKSLRRLSRELAGQGFQTSPDVVSRLLREDNFSLQSPRKRHEGKQHPDRDAQFHYINDAVEAALQAGDPVISIDTKAKQLIGNFAVKGREYRPQGQPVEVNVYDFPSISEGKAVPYGVYDVGANEGWVSVGCSKDTAVFAVNAIRTWWKTLGAIRYRECDEILITADCGGSNSNRARLFKRELQRFADELGKRLILLHYPPGTSKWNKIEHRMFSYISINMRGRPLTSFEVMVECIANTKTETGLNIEAALDPSAYQTGIKISDAEMQSVNLRPHEFHGEWNYTIMPAIQS